MNQNLQDKLNATDAWQTRIQVNDAEYATPEWKESAMRTVDATREVLYGLLREFGHAYLPTIEQAASGDSPLLTPVEVAAVRWQFQHAIGASESEKGKWTMLTEADLYGLEQLEGTFPVEVEAIRRWRNERGFSTRIDALLDRI